MNHMIKCFLVTSTLAAGSFHCNGAMQAPLSNNEAMLLNAACYGRSGTVKMLLVVYSVNVDVQDKWGPTALMKAAINGHTEVVRILLDAHAEVNAQDNNGCTALIHAVDKQAKTVRMILDTYAGVNIQDNVDTTALTPAAMRGRAEVVRMLLEAGADITLTNHQGKTALDLASEPYENAKVSKTYLDLANVNDYAQTIELLKKKLEEHQQGVQEAQAIVAEKWIECPLEIIEYCITPFGIKVKK